MTTFVKDLMTKDVVSLNQDEDFVSADQIMRLKHVRHLPVVSGKKLVGLVTHRDLLRAQAKLLTTLSATDEEQMISVTAADFMSEVLVTCRPDTPADDAARNMRDKKIGCVLVTENDQLVGILTETDIMSWAIEVMAKHRFDGTT